MGARLAITIKQLDQPVASVYAHHGGETVEDAERMVVRFLMDLNDLHDTRWSDPTYLAAKLVVWLAHPSQRSDNRMDFLSVGCGRPEYIEGMADAVVVLDSSAPFGTYEVVRAIDMTTTGDNQ